MSKYDDLIINLSIEESSHSSPALGQIDRLLKQSALEMQSLQVVRRVMLREMVDRAQVTGISKIRGAANLREKQRQALPSADLSAVNGNGAAPHPKKKKKKALDGRQSQTERTDEL